MKLILIAEDEYDIALALELLLTESGYRVFIVPNGQEMLKHLLVERPDLVIMDNMMPVLTGLEALQKMKSNPEYADIPVILMSAATPRGSQAELKWAAFIPKPFDIDCVLKVVATILK